MANLLAAAALLTAIACGGGATESPNTAPPAPTSPPPVSSPETPPPQAPPPAPTPPPPAADFLDVWNVVTPAPVRISGQAHLVYELFLRNNHSSVVTLTRLEVRGDGTPLQTYTAADLVGRFELLPDNRPAAEGVQSVRIPPGAEGVIFLWLTADSEAALPRLLTHQLEVADASGNAFSINVRALPVSDSQRPIFSPPVRGVAWVSINAPSDDSRQRRNIEVIDGEYFTAQRFAIDLVKVSDEGWTYAGDGRENENYFAHDEVVMAVADGTVVEVLDGIPETRPGDRPVRTLETLIGNAVVLDIGEGHYVVYGHLQGGLIAVRPGDHVTRGQVIGLIGNSGYSSEPHLHLHVCDAPSVLACHGVPWGFDRFVQQPMEVEGVEAFTVWSPEQMTGEIPMPFGYLRFQ